MSSTLAEQARVGHQEMENGVNRIVKLLAHQTKTHKQKLMQQHKVLKEVYTIQRSAKKVWKYYDDSDVSRKQEMDSMSGNDVFNAFYGRLRELREYHKKFPNLHAEPELDAFQVNLDDDPDILSQFTGEEFFGRFLDLNPHHIKFINLKGTKAVTYEAYLNIFDDFTSVPEEVRNKKYLDYIKDLKDYLESCVKRTKPLQDVEKMLEMSTEDFEQRWATQGPLTKAATGVGGKRKMDEPLQREVRLDPYESWEELTALGLEPLKTELQRLGLKCGGTLEQRAQRLWASRHAHTASDLDPSILAAGAVPTAPRAPAKMAAGGTNGAGGGDNAEDDKKARALRKEIGLLEHQIGELCDVLRDVIEATQAQVQKKQSRTPQELAKEMEDEVGDAEPESSSSEDEGEKPIYNPKKVPLDWTGKPIPYWLYKLHGLNLEYKCEICGNFSYWGPRAFERHFQEWRHAHGLNENKSGAGMRCLKVPNTRAFHNITKIKDAVELFEKLQSEKKKVFFNAEVEEEYEDAAGNVLSKKTFHDLLRQGLL